MTRPTTGPRFLTSVLAVLGIFDASETAFAHAHLKSASPAVGSTVSTAPSELDLKFSEAVNLKFTGAKVTGPDKAVVPTGTVALAAGDAATLVVPLQGTVMPGVYTVTWHALSDDGHKTSGAYSFTVKP